MINVKMSDIQRLRLKQANKASKELGCKNILRKRAFRVLTVPLTVSGVFTGDQRVIKTEYVTMELVVNEQTLKWDVLKTDFDSFKENNLLCFRNGEEIVTSR